MSDKPAPLDRCSSDYDKHAAYWLAKLCLSSDKYLRQMISGGYAEEIRELVGVTLPTNDIPHTFLRAQLRQRLATLKKKQTGKSELFANTRLLANLLRLNEVEQSVIQFIALSTHHQVMRVMMENAPLHRTDELFNMLSVALDWTGHPGRLNRALGRLHGKEAYAYEELVAEIGAAFLCAHCGLPARLEHASYIDSWLGALRRDKRLIFVAASAAQKAVDFVLEQATRANVAQTTI